MSEQGPVAVRKCDGSQEAFQVDKLRRSLAAAMRDCHYDPRFAESLARAVAIHLDGWRGYRPPSTDYIFRCVRTVLGDTGLADVARQLAIHRRHRALRRRALMVLDPRRGGRGTTPWRKRRVCQTLQTRFELNPSAARIIAGEIEERILSLNYNVISTALVAELIRNELLAWGLLEEDHGQRQARASGDDGPAVSLDGSA